jgi:hypothetical protein
VKPKPVLPRQSIRLVEFVDEVEEETHVLPV